MRHQQLDTTLLEPVPQRVRVVSTIGNYPFRFLPRTTPSPARDAATVDSASVTSAGEALASCAPKGMPWPSTSTIHFVPFPRLVFPTAEPLFWPTRSCHPERFRPIAVVAADSARPATAATPPAKHPRLPTAADAASRSPR